LISIVSVYFVFFSYLHKTLLLVALELCRYSVWYITKSHSGENTSSEFVTTSLL